MGLLPHLQSVKSWFPAQVLNGQQIGNSCSSTREGKTGYFGKVSEKQAEESFRKSKVRKAVTKREFESSGEVTQGPEVACLAEARLKARGSVWHVLLTCCGRRDGSPALEGNKVSKIQHGEGPGFGCAVLGCDFKLERIPLCYGEKSGHKETGAGGCAGHRAQLITALGSSVASAGDWWAAESS